MKYIDEFRKAGLVKKLAAQIRKITPVDNINIMEVCGTHTQNFFRFGLDKLLPSNLRFIPGPGCPVCVSSQEYIDRAILYARERNVNVLTFGDMLRVPGTRSTLEKERAKKGNVMVAYSALDALAFSRKNPHKKIVFLAVGFETTASTIALSVLEAKKEKIRNLFFLSSLKTIPVVMRSLLEDKNLKISAFLCPGHVSAIIGTKPYEFIPREYHISCCVAGFEPLDILEGTYLILSQIIKKRPRVENQYQRLVTRNGNRKAQDLMAQVFKRVDVSWRGLGTVKRSGLALKKEFAEFDAEKVIPLKIKSQTASSKQKLCRCGQVIKGLITPDECPLFKKTCSPENPYGPCMVSMEGACNAYYKYKQYDE